MCLRNAKKTAPSAAGGLRARVSSRARLRASAGAVGPFARLGKIHANDTGLYIRYHFFAAHEASWTK